MSGIQPLHAVKNSYASNWELQDGTVRWLKQNGFESIVALMNAERISKIKASGVKQFEDISGLEEGMRVLGFDPTADAESHIKREFEVPSGPERDW